MNSDVIDPLMFNDAAAATLRRSRLNSLANLDDQDNYKTARSTDNITALQSRVCERACNIV